MKRFVDVLKTLLHGMAIGIANLMPGVSGGTVAVILGIYHTLIDHIDQLFSRSPLKQKKQAFLTLFCIGIGAGISILFLAQLFLYLLDTRQQLMSFFFIGLIIGCIPAIVFSENTVKPTLYHFCILFVFAYLMILLSQSQEFGLHVNTLSPYFLAFSGMIAGATMVVPGVSGSLILLILGTYGPILKAIAELNIPIILIVGSAALLGIILFSKLISLVFKTYPSETNYAIIGLLFGSIPAIWVGFEFNNQGLLSLMILMAGILISKNLSIKT